VPSEYFLKIVYKYDKYDNIYNKYCTAIFSKIKGQF